MRTRRKWPLILVLAAAATLGGLAIWHQTNRVHFIQTLCEAGLPNLSKPDRVAADELGCVVLGPKRRVDGFAEGGFEHSAIVVGDRYEIDARGLYTNETAWYQGGWSEPELSSPPEACWRRIIRISVEGWMTEREGRFGHLGIARRAFYPDRVHTVGPVEPEDISHWSPDSREHACTWGGERGWISLAAMPPAA